MKPMPEPPSTSRRLLHPALDGNDGAPLVQARLTDQQRLAVVLQGAALAAHLEHGGWYLASGWEEVRVTEDGLLRVGSVCQGRDAELVQVVLLRLIRRLFRTEGEVAGRGEARRAARHLLNLWPQVLAPSVPDQMVAEILETAPFLWQPAFGEARAALAGEHVVGRRTHLWVAGPGSARRRLLARSRDRQELTALLRGAEALDLWEGFPEDADPEALAASGRWRRAVTVWRRQPPRTARDRLAYARSLFALGRFSQGLSALKGQSGFAARLLRVNCQYNLGELNAAELTLRRLATSGLTPAQTIDLADVAVRVLAGLGQREGIREWMARCLAVANQAADHRLRWRAFLAATTAAWDLDDEEAMDRHLEASRGALDDPELAGRWLRRRGLRSIAARDGEGAVAHLTPSLRQDRRRLLRFEVGRLWNDVAVARTLVDDLPGAERACRHALRLLSRCEGPLRTTLALYNLAEVRLRRGRVAGVEAILEVSTAENRRAGNHRGLIRDLELWVRFELAQGRCTAALARCGEARPLLDRGPAEPRRGVFDLLAARAYGWLGRRDEAAACLGRCPAETLRELEPEERPAVWALAGAPERAAAEAAGTLWAGLWTALGADQHPDSRAWEALGHLEPYRAARLTFDCERLRPGVVPPSRLHEAVATLRRCGAEALAEMLESRSLTPWRALERFLATPGGDAGAVAELVRGAGYGDVKLTWKEGEKEQILVAGSGGEEELLATIGEGRLRLEGRHFDSPLRTLFAVIRQHFTPPAKGRPRRRRPASRGGMVGESPALIAALTRLDQLAAGDLPVLILGESGTGKELAARRVHAGSRRSPAPFLAVNCAALSETLILSDLFGHVRGAFTGADRDRPGVFESARGGTVFLDEIGDLPLTAQGMLLRALQEGEIRRVGESFARKIDVRVVAATHRDLGSMVRDGRFRQDLYYRLKVATIRLPPLRQRGRDVMLLADHFLAHRSPGGPAAKLSPGARERLASYPWPGNIRELRNVLEVAAMLAADDPIRPEDLDLPEDHGVPAGDYHRQVEAFRRKLVAEALTASGGNRTEAARRLGVSRQALSYLVRQLGVT